MANLVSIQQASQDPAVEILLPEATALSVEANWSTIMNNFSKIGSWIMQGSESPNPLPPVLQAAADQMANNSQALADLRDDYKTLEKTLADATASYNKTVSQMQLDEGQAVATLRDAMTKEMAALREEMTAAAPAKKTRAKKEPEVAPVEEAVIESAPAAEVPAAVEPDQVDLTAAAVGAGELDGDSLAALDGLLMSL